MNSYCEFANKNTQIKSNEKVVEITNKTPLKTKITHINLVDNKDGKNKRKSKLYTNIFFEEFSYFSNRNFDYIVSTLILEIKRFIKLLNFKKKNLTYFIVGLGNNEIEADKLGYLVTKKIISTNIKSNKNKFNDIQLGKVFSLSPSTANNNGVYTVDIIKGLNEYFKPDLIILIDSMSCKNIEILAKAIQLSNVGFTPGCEINNKQPSITTGFLNTPIITIGCPLVCDLININKEYKTSKILTIKDINFAVNKFATIIAFALNKIIHKSLKDEEIIFLMKD